MSKQRDQRLLQALDEPPLLGLGFNDLSGLDEPEKKFLDLLQQSSDLPEFLKFVNETVVNYGVDSSPTLNTRAKRTRSAATPPVKQEQKPTVEPVRRQQPSRNQKVVEKKPEQQIEVKKNNTA